MLAKAERTGSLDHEEEEEERLLQQQVESRQLDQSTTNPELDNTLLKVLSV